MIVVFFGSTDAKHHGEQGAGEDEHDAADSHEGTGRESEETDGSEDERDNDGDVATHEPILWVGDPRPPVPRPSGEGAALIRRLSREDLGKGAMRIGGGGHISGGVGE